MEMSQLKIMPIVFWFKRLSHPIPWVRDMAIVHSGRLRV